MVIRHRQQAEKKQQKTISEYSKQAVIMGYTDDIEQGTNNLRKAHPQVKQIMGSYQVRRRLSLAGIGIALFGAVAVVTFVTMHMNGKSSKCHLCWSREKHIKRRFSMTQIDECRVQHTTKTKAFLNRREAMQEYLCNSIDHALLPAPTLINIGRAGTYDS